MCVCVSPGNELFARLPLWSYSCDDVIKGAWGRMGGAVCKKKGVGLGVGVVSA